MPKYLFIAVLFLMPFVRTAVGQRFPLPPAGSGDDHATDDGSTTASYTLDPDALLFNVRFGAAPGQSGSVLFPSSTPTCTDGFEPPNDNNGIGGKGVQPLMVQLNDTLDQHECDALAATGYDYAGGSQPDDLHRGYDTLKLFIESCATIPSVRDWGAPWHAFSALTKCVSDMDTANIRWLEYRDWLKKVLYYSTDSLYYCADVTEMFSTLNYLEPGQRWLDVSAMIAIIDYLLSTNRCPEQTASLLSQRSYYRGWDYSGWQDTVRDSVKTPYDSSAKNIDSLGFSILRGPQFGAVKPRAESSGEYLADLVASKNPFADETTLETTLHEATMLRIDVFDVLGKQLYSEKQFFTAGPVRWRLDGHELPKGSLYVRVSTYGGVVKTIKLDFPQLFRQ